MMKNIIVNVKNHIFSYHISYHIRQYILMDSKRVAVLFINKLESELELELEYLTDN